MTAMIALAALSLSFQTGNIDNFVQTNIRDISLTAKVVNGNKAELEKINGDFALAYRVQFTNMWMKEPFMMRLESDVEDTHVIVVINGVTRVIRVPKARIVARKDLANHPGQRQTILDSGVLTPSLLADLYDAKFIRVDRESGDSVFDLTYKTAFKDFSRSRVWIDPEKKYTTKREWFNQQGRQLATFLYDHPKNVAGVWFPTRMTVKNTDNMVAGVTQYEKIKVNTGLNDSLFNVK
jgi:outer membrane lipoprotein-sorting protein